MLKSYYGQDANDSGIIKVRNCDPLTRKEYNRLERENNYFKAEITRLRAGINRKDELITKARLTLEKYNRWTGQATVQDHVPESAARIAVAHLERALENGGGRV